MAEAPTAIIYTERQAAEHPSTQPIQPRTHGTAHCHIHTAPVPNQRTACTAHDNRIEEGKEGGQNEAVTPTANVVHTATDPVEPVKLQKRQQARRLRLPAPALPPELRPTPAWRSPMP